jgi:hypothetical protein
MSESEQAGASANSFMQSRPSAAVTNLNIEGLVLGSQDATPLEFWVGVQGQNQIELDDLVVVETVSPRGQLVRFFGIVDTVHKRYEGAQYDSDAFRAAAGTLPVDISYAAHVQVTRVDPEVFIPPQPGDAVRIVRGEEFQRALYFDRMEHRLPIGLTRTPSVKRKGCGCRSNLRQMKRDKCFKMSCGFITRLTQRSALNEFFKRSQNTWAISVIQSRTNFRSLSWLWRV